MSPKITKKINFPTTGTYVVAVSGGVDSMALLDILFKEPGHKIIVAHFDHGIRPDVSKDRQLIADYCKNHNLELVIGEGHLGENASEGTARNARYKFLNGVRFQYEAQAIITGHHRDDRVETLIFNVVRGTGTHGQGALKDQLPLLRPLLNVSRSEILDYAQKHQVPWREDTTNQDMGITRNFIRQKLLPLMEHFDPQARPRLAEFMKKQEALAVKKDKQSAAIASQLITAKMDKIELRRSAFLALENPAARDLIYYLLKKHFPAAEPSAALVGRLEHFCKTASAGAKLNISGQVDFIAGPESITWLTSLK